MKHIVEPLFVSHCILVQYCFLSFISIILRHMCPVHQVRARSIETFPTAKSGDCCCDSVPPWYSRIEPKPCTVMYESTDAQAFWNVSVYAEHTFVRANRVDGWMRDL